MHHDYMTWGTWKMVRGQDDRSPDVRHIWRSRRGHPSTHRRRRVEAVNPAAQGLVFFALYYAFASRTLVALQAFY